jgi:hypothetical protein
VPEADVCGDRAKEWDSLADQDRDSRHDHFLDETGAQESLDGFSAVDVGILKTFLFERGDDASKPEARADARVAMGSTRWDMVAHGSLGDLRRCSAIQ